MPSQRFGDAAERGINRTLGALENKLATAIDGIKISINSALASSLRSNSTTTNDSEPIGSWTNHEVQENASNMLTWLAAIQILMIIQS